MNLLALFSAILFGVISPVALPGDLSVGRALAVRAEDYVVVAMIPSDEAGHEERLHALGEAAESIALQTGKSVVLTDDLCAYLSLKRMSLRGVSDYERKVLVSRLSRGKEGLYIAPIRSEAS